jgi:2-polyprenyl-3-methyl-5-hydroxy-6-metoxy-1,4-benzoquinol methylase
MVALLKIRWGRYQRVAFTGNHQPCPLCDSDDRVVIGRLDRWFNPLVNVLCRYCGLIFLDPMPSDEELDRYYTDQFWSRSQGSDEPTAKTIAKATRYSRGRLELLAPFLKPGMRVLDDGAGGGEFLLAARQRAYEVEGIEPSAGYARYCRQTYGLNVHAATLADTGLGDRTFDLITCNHSLEHMRDPLRALQRLHDHLKADGHLYVSVPDLGDLHIWPLRYFHAGHMCGFTHETLVMLAAKAGFAPVDRQPFGTDTTLVFRLRHFLSPRTYWRVPGRISYFLRNRALSIRSAIALKRPQKQT